MSGVEAIVPVIVCLAQCAQQACDVAQKHQKECERINDRLVFLLSLIAEWLESADKKPTPAILNSMKSLERALERLNQVLHREGTTTSAKKRASIIPTRLRRLIFASGGLANLKKAEDDLNAALQDFQLAQMRSISFQIDSLRSSTSSESPKGSWPVATAVAQPVATATTTATKNQSEAIVEKYDAWRKEGLKVIRQIDNLYDFLAECESGYVKFGLSQLQKAQLENGGTTSDLTAWAKQWAKDLLQPHDSDAYAKANMLDAYRKVALQLLYSLCDYCMANGISNPSSVFKPRFAEGILVTCLVMDRAKCLYWLNQGGLHWYSKSDELYGGWMHWNDSAPGRHTINRRYRWIMDTFLHDSAKRAMLEELLKPCQTQRDFEIHFVPHQAVSMSCKH